MSLAHWSRDAGADTTSVFFCSLSLLSILKSLNVVFQNSPRLDINCTDYDGNTALVLAVKNGDADMVELLLEFDDILVEDALLHAVQLGHVHIVEMLIDKQRCLFWRCSLSKKRSFVWFAHHCVD